MWVSDIIFLIETLKKYYVAKCVQLCAVSLRTSPIDGVHAVKRNTDGALINTAPIIKPGLTDLPLKISIQENTLLSKIGIRFSY